MTGHAQQLGDILRLSREWLAGRGVDNAAREADELAARVLGCRRLDLYLQHDRVPSEAQCIELRRFLRRRAAGEPLQYLLGSQPFRNASILVDSRVLIPRPETEELVGLVLERERACVVAGEDVTVLDVGTGSGCVAISLAQELSTCRILAVDKDQRALELARDNARRNGVEDRIEFRCLNILQTWPETPVQVMVSNPPYVSLSDRHLLARELAHEPDDALFGGDDGLVFYRRFATGLEHLLAPGGRFYFEIGADQGDELLRLFTGRCTRLEMGRDLAGRPRFLSGALPD